MKIASLSLPGLLALTALAAAAIGVDPAAVMAQTHPAVKSPSTSLPEVSALLTEARGYLAENKLIDPPGQNAREALMLLRKTDPANPEVLQLSRTLSERLVDKARLAMRAKAYERSKQLLDAAREMADSDMTAVAQVESELREARELSAARDGSASLRAEDFLDIEQLYARYNHAIDSGNAEEWAATFTPDGVFNNRFTGRDALVGFVNSWKANGLNRRHWNSNLTLTGTSEGATGSVYLMLMDVGVKPAAVLATGVYSDQLVRTSLGWRFKSRVVKMDTAQPAKPNPAAVPDKPK
jgi:hypothetical protein